MIILLLFNTSGFKITFKQGNTKKINIQNRLYSKVKCMSNIMVKGHKLEKGITEQKWVKVQVKITLIDNLLKVQL